MRTKIFSLMAVIAIMIGFTPTAVFAAAGIFPSGGGTKTVGQTFTITVTASGAEFNAFQGAISVSGPVSVVSVTAGSADTWMSKPSSSGTFSGALLGRKATSLTIATIKLKGTSAGKGALVVSGAVLKNGAATVGSSGGTSAFTIQKAPELPGAVNVSSTTHPDQATPYEATTVSLSWNKDSGVDGFAYLLDQAEGTNPESKITSAETSATFENQAVGTYFFHIKAHKADGWGAASHFKITIKEPDPKIDEALSKPSELKIERVANAFNDIEMGELTGVVISGKTEAGYTANISLEPAPTIPEGKSLSVLSGDDGAFSLLIDFPLKAGFYKLTVQGQLAKVLTPLSDLQSFEISLKEGGAINLITASDSVPPIKKAEVKGSFLKREFPVMSYLVFSLILAVIAFVIIEIIIYAKRRKPLYR